MRIERAGGRGFGCGVGGRTLNWLLRRAGGGGLIAGDALGTGGRLEGTGFLSRGARLWFVADGGRCRFRDRFLTEWIGGVVVARIGGCGRLLIIWQTPGLIGVAAGGGRRALRGARAGNARRSPLVVGGGSLCDRGEGPGGAEGEGRKLEPTRGKTGEKHRLILQGEQFANQWRPPALFRAQATVVIPPWTKGLMGLSAVGG